MTLNYETEIPVETLASVFGEMDPEKTAHRVIVEALEKIGCPFEAQVNLLLTDDDAIHEMNRQFRGIDRATDVLSFPMLSFETPGDFSFLDEEGRPSVVEQCKVLPPQSRMGAIEDAERYTCLLQDGMAARYDTALDRESAYEILKARFEEAEEEARRIEEEKIREAEEKERQKEEERLRKEQEKEERERKREEERLERERRREEERLERERRREEEREAREQAKKTAALQKGISTAVNTFAREATKSIVRGLFGNRKRR